MVSVSSNFPDQMEATQDSLWAVMLERIRVFWCGIDVILHLGGQVPLHEAAMESFQWVQKEEKCRIARSRHGQLMPDDDVALRQKVRRRFQQQYHRSWNLPNIREILASCSNWFLRAQADIAPFFRNHALHTNAAQLVLDIAKEVFAEYQLALMETTQAPPIKSSQQDATSVQSTPDLSAAMSFIEPKELELNKAINSSTNGPNEGDSNLIVQPSNRESQDNLDQIVPSVSTTNFIQQGEIGVFFLDMRAVPDDDVITCNNRLSRPLNRQERPVIGEEQWQQFEVTLFLLNGVVEFQNFSSLCASFRCRAHLKRRKYSRFSCAWSFRSFTQMPSTSTSNAMLFNPRRVSKRKQQEAGRCMTETTCLNTGWRVDVNWSSSCRCCSSGKPSARAVMSWSSVAGCSSAWKLC